MSAGTHVLNIPAFIKGVNEVEYRLSSEYIGIIKVSIPDMVIMDWFGFVRLKKRLVSARNIQYFRIRQFRLCPTIRL